MRSSHEVGAKAQILLHQVESLAVEEEWGVHQAHKDDLSCLRVPDPGKSGRIVSEYVRILQRIFGQIPDVCFVPPTRSYSHPQESDRVRLGSLSSSTREKHIGTFVNGMVRHGLRRPRLLYMFPQITESHFGSDTSRNIHAQLEQNFEGLQRVIAMHAPVWGGRMQGIFQIMNRRLNQIALHDEPPHISRIEGHPLGIKLMGHRFCQGVGLVVHLRENCKVDVVGCFTQATHDGSSRVRQIPLDPRHHVVAIDEMVRQVGSLLCKDVF